MDVIKIMATGGNMTPTQGPHESQYTLPELTAAVDDLSAIHNVTAVFARRVRA